MRELDTKLGRVFAERSKEGDALHIGVAGGAVNGFASVPVDDRTLLRGLVTLGAAVLLHGALRRGKKRGARRRF